MCVFFEGVSIFYFSTFSVIIQEFKHPVLSLILLCLFVSVSVFEDSFSPALAARF